MRESYLDRLARLAAGTPRPPAPTPVTAPPVGARSRGRLLEEGATTAGRRLPAPHSLELAPKLPPLNRRTVLKLAGALGLVGSLAALARPREARAADPCTEACQRNGAEGAQDLLAGCLGGARTPVLVSSLWMPATVVAWPVCAMWGWQVYAVTQTSCQLSSVTRDDQGNCLYEGPNPSPPPGRKPPSSFPPPKQPPAKPPPESCGDVTCVGDNKCCPSPYGLGCCAVGCAKDGSGCCSGSDCGP
jgi:hypothetical protein